MATGRPSLRVKLDNGTGTFPYDITTYVHLPSGWTNQRGRGSEFDSIDASTLTITLNNNDGRFTLDSSTYGIFVDQMIQVSEALDGVTWVPRFTGYVQNWPTSWTSGPATLSLSTVTAVDRLARLERRTLRSMLEQEILADGPLLYYTLAETGGSESAGNTSYLNWQPPLTIAGSGTEVVFGSATGPAADGLTAATFAAGQYLRADLPLPVSTSFGATLECFFLLTPALATATILSMSRYSGEALSLGYNSGTGIFASVFNGFTTGATSGYAGYSDGQWHHAAVNWDPGAGTLALYVDGILKETKATAISAFQPTAVVAGTFDGSLAHVAFKGGSSMVSAARILEHATAGLTGFIGDSSDERISRLAGYGEIATADMALEAGALTSVANQATSGASLMSALQDVVQSEGGALFIDGAGDLVFQNRTHRIIAATGTATLALATGDAGVDLIWSADKNYMTNYATGTRPNGAALVAINQDSIDVHEQYPTSRSLLATTDTEVQGAIDWQVNVYGEVQPRITQVTIDLLTQPSATIRTAALNLELGDRITISGMPSQAPVSTADLIVEGWTETYGKDVWTLELNTVSASNFHAFTADHTTYGVADAGNRAIY